MTRRLLGASWLSVILLLSACGGGSGGGGPSTVAVPAVVGLTQAAASAALSGASLATGAVSTQTSTTVAAGVVISQNPASGTSVATGTVVALVVSAGPPVMVPNVAGLSQAAAATAITGAGLTVGSSTAALSATVAVGNVISQNPAAGSSVAPGSPITLVISLGPPVAVPNVVGQTQSAATAALTGAGLALGAVTTQSSATIAAGSVISQNPAAAAVVALGSAVSLVVSTGAAAANTLPVVIDSGPSALLAAGQTAANTLYATVTLCTPGSSTACATIDHIQIDTGSVGLQVLAEALKGSSFAPTKIIDPASNSALLECVQFADGYSWGSMVIADVTIGSRHLSNLAMHLIGDSGIPAAPSSCIVGPSENTVVQFGANGILGVGYWLQDCGSYCTTTAASGGYYVCPNGTCSPTTVAVANQAQNPVALFSSDNNGVMIELPQVSPPGLATVQGTVYFGIGTQANNALGSAVFYAADGYGYLVTTYNGTAYNQSFIDSGSNGYFFSSSITQCKTATGFYCPAGSTVQSAKITGAGANPSSISIGFTVDNAETLFSQSSLTAFPNLAGSNSIGSGLSSSFDWGLPFFFGRKVYVLFENNGANGTVGPASAF